MVLESDDKNLKALFRVAVAYRNMKEYEKANETLLRAQKIKDSASIRNELKRVEAALATQRARNDNKFRKAFKKQAAANKRKNMTSEDAKESAEGGADFQDEVKNKENVKPTDEVD